MVADDIAIMSREHTLSRASALRLGCLSVRQKSCTLRPGTREREGGRSRNSLSRASLAFLSCTALGRGEE